jgi:ribonuclease HII
MTREEAKNAKNEGEGRYIACFNPAAWLFSRLRMSHSPGACERRRSAHMSATKKTRSCSRIVAEAQLGLDLPAAEGVCAGLDEAGRGPLAGPVVAAAVILNPASSVGGLADSKVLSSARREELEPLIKRHALAWAVASASVEEIDAINILQASMLAMQRALAGLALRPDYALIDGDRCPPLPCPAQAVVGGDGSVPAISAASILAKVARDREMRQMDGHYPGYGFASHKGYATEAHLEALVRLGPTPIHRRSFAPVRALLAGADAAEVLCAATAADLLVP